MKKLLLFLTLFSVFFFSKPTQSRATHNLGGEITWECLKVGNSQGKLVFTVKLYCACYQNAATCPTWISLGNPLYSLYGGVSFISCARISIRDLTEPYCYDTSQWISCGAPYNAGGMMAISEYTYRSAPVQINGIPDTAGSDFFWSTCCRPSALNKVGQTGYYLRSTIYPYTDQSSNTTLSFGGPSGPTCYDSSPEFDAAPAPVACAGTNVSLFLGCYSDDDDSLVYNWSDPMQADTIPITWQAGYSKTSPFPNTLLHPSNVPATLNNSTGVINFNNMVLNGQGYHVYCVQVSSYRKGQKISDIYRDIPITIFNCPPPILTNTLPTIELKDAGKANFKTMLDTAIEVGSYIELDLRSTDVDTLPTSTPSNLQSVDIRVTGTAMSEVPNNSLNCAYKPCAFLDTTGITSWKTNLQRFVDSGQVNTVFKWQTNCGLLFPTSIYNGQPHIKEFTFYIHSSDNFCPQPGQSVLRFKITVYDSTTIPLPFTEIDASAGGAKLKWDQYNNSNFQSYNVFRSFSSTGPWVFIHNATLSNTTTYHDQIARTDTFIHYYKLKVNNSFCLETGYEARSIFLKGKLESNGIVTLNWNNPQDDLGVTGQYSVLRRYDNGAWTQIATKNISSPAYQDFTPFTARYNYYKIQITDSKGLTSISNVIEIERDTPVVIVPGIQAVEQNAVQLLPNPFRNELMLIDESGKLLGGTIVFYNVLGDRVYEYRVQEVKSKIDLKGLKQGVYFVHYKDIDGNTGSRRLVKME